MVSFVKNSRYYFSVIVLSAIAAAGFGLELPQGSTSIKEELSEPFCYYLYPSDQLGFKDCPHGTQLTYDGAFNAGLGELDLFIGSSLKPVNKRVKTLYKEYIPVFSFTDTADGLEYEIQALATPYDLEPMNILINFISITAKNPTDKAVNAAVKAQYSDRKQDDFRYDFNRNLHRYYTDQFLLLDNYKSSADGHIADGQAWRGDHLVFTYAAGEQAEGADISLTQSKDPAVTYSFSLAAGSSRTIYLKMPFVPVYKEKTDILEQVNSVNHADYLNRTIAFWEKEIAKGTQISLDDEKVTNVDKASMVYMLMARNIMADGTYQQHVNEFQYDYFFSRDVAYFTRIYNMYNRPHIARDILDHFIKYDKDGKPVGFNSFFPDDWGQVLWTMGAHVRATNDKEFARFVFPLILGHFDKLIRLCNDDPLGLWPAAGPYDNEAITGHYTGHSFWILLGMKEAIYLADLLGEKDYAAFYQSVYDSYNDRFRKVLGEKLEFTGGYIPPGLDNPEDGYDWANSTGGVYPYELLDPFDPVVTRTLELTREYKYREGIMTYGPNALLLALQNARGEEISPSYWLHHYQTFNIDEPLLARGQQREVVEDMYSILAHTGSTQSGFEFAITPWGERNAYDNYTPHGWFAARFKELLRNMLVREYQGTLHLASALAPQWLRPGKTVKITDAATDFGMLSYTIRAAETGADVELESDWRTEPKQILWHIPWFLEVTGVTADGKKLALIQLPNDQAVALPANTQKLHFDWKWKEQPELSYAKAVELYLDKNYNRPEDADYCFLFPTPRAPRIKDNARDFSGTAAVELYIPGGIGKIYYTLNGEEPTESSAQYQKPLTIDATVTIKAITIWSDGRKSIPVSYTFTKS